MVVPSYMGQALSLMQQMTGQVSPHMAKIVEAKTGVPAPAITPPVTVTGTTDPSITIGKTQSTTIPIGKVSQVMNQMTRMAMAQIKTLSPTIATGITVKRVLKEKPFCPADVTFDLLNDTTTETTKTNGEDLPEIPDDILPDTTVPSEEGYYFFPYGEMASGGYPYQQPSYMQVVPPPRESSIDKLKTFIKENALPIGAVAVGLVGAWFLTRSKTIKRKGVKRG